MQTTPSRTPAPEFEPCCWHTRVPSFLHFLPALSLGIANYTFLHRSYQVINDQCSHNLLTVSNCAHSVFLVGCCVVEVCVVDCAERDGGL